MATPYFVRVYHITAAVKKKQITVLLLEPVTSESLSGSSRTLERLSGM